MSARLVLGQLRAHAGRYLGTLLAIAVAVAFVLASVGVLRTMAASADATFGMRYGNTAVLVQNPATGRPRAPRPRGRRRPSPSGSAWRPSPPRRACVR